MRTLTELYLFAEAVKESVELMQGTGILLPYGQYVAISSPQVCYYCPDIFIICKSYAPIYCQQCIPDFLFYSFCAANKDIPQQQVPPGQC